MIMKADLKVAVCQMRIVDSKTENLTRAGELINAAANNGADLIVLPEIFNIPYQADLMVENAELYPGRTTDYLAELARRHSVILVGGSIPEIDTQGCIFNSSFVFDEKGALIGRHRKMHLFDVDIPGQIFFQESAVFCPGEGLQIIRHGGLSFAVIICYDIRFPELARWAALAGAELLVVPAAFNLTTGPAHWEILMRSRAIDNQLYVIAASPARNPEASYQAWGHSMVVDPWGNITSQADIAESVIYADLDLGLVSRIRQELPLLRHRRTDIYKLKYPRHD